MSLYNALFGTHSGSTVFLAMLGLTSNDVPRFRTCFLQDDHIVIHTRTGGGNRDYYDSEESCRSNYPEMFATDGPNPEGPWNSDLISNEFYVRDEDDDFDCTYANFYFRFPPDYEAELKALAAGDPQPTPSEKWQELFKKLGESL